MPYDTWYERRSRGRRTRRPTTPRHPGRAARRAAPPSPPDRRHPFPLAGRGYEGPGELGRYGRAPVPYGPDHTYDYHLGDRYGYGPDFVLGEERIRGRRLPDLRPRRGGPRQRPHGEWKLHRP